MASPHVIIPATTKQTATIIFLHGLGDTGHGWSQSIEAIKPSYIKLICPTASVKSIAINSGMKMPAWFNIFGLNPTSEEDIAGIKSASSFIQGLIKTELDAGIQSERIMIGGFSMGGALALYTGLTYPQKLAGIIALSCWLPMHQQIKAMNIVNRDIPILQCHGTSDQIVAHSFGMLTSAVLQTVSTKAQFKSYPGLMHSTSDPEMMDIKSFIEETLPSLPESEN